MTEKFLLIFIHILCASVWLGCVLVEAIYEHSIEPTKQMRDFVARLHWSTDKYIEIPAFIGTLVTGTGLLLANPPITSLLIVKIAFGLLAIVFNAICVALVIKRLSAVKDEDYSRYEKLDDLQHKLGAVVLIGIVVALGIGGYLFSRGIF